VAHSVLVVVEGSVDVHTQLPVPVCEVEAVASGPDGTVCEADIVSVVPVGGAVASVPDGTVCEADIVSVVPVGGAVCVTVMITVDSAHVL
jgi:hypothetical protein